MRNAGLGDGLQVEVLPDLDELVLADIADQDDWHLDLRTRSWPVLRSWPFVGDHAGMHILAAQLRPFFIGEDVCGFDARSRRVISPRYGACRQLPDLIESTEPFAGCHDQPLSVWCEEIDHALNIDGSHRVCHRPDNAGFGSWTATKVLDLLTAVFVLIMSSSDGSYLLRSPLSAIGNPFR
jgi:hypothetical protein